VPPPSWANELAFASNRTGEYHIYRAAHNGSTATKLTPNNFGGNQPVWSPDRRWIIYSRQGDLWALHVASGLAATINGINSTAEEFSPSFAPTYSGTATTFNGQIAFSSNRSGGDHDIFVATVNLSYTGSSITASGSGVQNLTDEGGGTTFDDRQPVWSPSLAGGINHNRIAFRSNRGGGNNEIYVVNATGGGITAVTSTASPIVNIQPEWAPNGEWLAFASKERHNSNFDLYATRYNTTNGTWNSTPVRLTTNSQDDNIMAWRNDGGTWRIAFTREPVDTDNSEDILVLTLNSSTLQVTTVTTPSWNSIADDTSPDW
jgi:Tol biopolymer transport system component